MGLTLNNRLPALFPVKEYVAEDGVGGRSFQDLGELDVNAYCPNRGPPAGHEDRAASGGADVTMENAAPHAVPRPGGTSAVDVLRSRRHRRLTGIGNVFRPFALEDLLSPVDLVAVVRMD